MSTLTPTPTSDWATPSCPQYRGPSLQVPYLPLQSGSSLLPLQVRPTSPPTGQSVTCSYFQDLTPASRHNFVPTLVLMKFIKRDKSLHMAILNSESVFKVINLHLEDGRRPSKSSAHKFQQINTKIRKCCVVFRGFRQ